jgi:hypothetical protein
LSPVWKRVGFSKSSSDIWCIWQDFQFIRLFKPTVLNLGSEDIFQGLRELGWEKKWNFISANI